MPNTLNDREWDILIQRIKKGKCTPFLGSGACFGCLPLGPDIAKKWAKTHNYPLEDTTDLAQVAQYIAVKNDPMFPKELILEWFENIDPPDFDEPNEPHGFLADLPLPVYMTTNFDDFMVQALKDRKKDANQELCRWNKYIQEEQGSIFESDSGFEPTPANPVVFHLHGRIEVPESLVLTEDDYLDFLVNVSRDKDLLPPRIQRAMAGTSLLFIGYSLEDWDFRVLFRGLVTTSQQSLRRISVTVQLPSEDEESMSYLDEYFNSKEIRVFWGTAREFTEKLREKCQEAGIL